MGLGRNTSIQSLTWICTNQTISWLLHSLGIFGVKTKHEQPPTYKIHHGPNLGEATTFPPYSILYTSTWGPHSNGTLSWDSQVGVLKFPQLGFPWLWGPITQRVDLRLQWGLKRSYSPCQEIANGMLHTTFTREN
jgi:hypothetical protein